MARSDNKISPSATVFVSTNIRASDRSLKESATPSNRKLRTQLLRMFASMTIPVLGVIVFSVVIYRGAKSTYDESQFAKRMIEGNVAVSELATSLQRERAMTAMYISSTKTKNNAHEHLTTARQETDKRSRAISEWSAELFLSDYDTRNLRKLMAHVREMRTDIDLQVLNLSASMDLFTSVNKQVIKWSSTSLHKPYMAPITTNDAILQASENYGQQRALGTQFFSHCRFSKTQFERFSELEGRAASLMQIAFRRNVAPKAVYWESQDIIAESTRFYETLKAYFWDAEFVSYCKNSSRDERYNLMTWWFNNSTDFINMVHKTRRDVVTRSIVELNEIISESRFEMIRYTLMMIAVIALCLTTTALNAYSVHNLARSLKLYAERMNYEQRRADNLLYQMLPRPIADQLKRNIDIPAELYDSVTVYFSDVVGFTEFASQVSPMVVVSMLNQLYSQFDTCIGRYDVYKVETIGDGYMVASGLPKRNGKRHATEIALLAIDIVRTVDNFTLDAYAEHRFQVRIGIHTGPCVAGVVGTKMPRYCLFGDTVNTASRMESTGEAQKIHISEATFSQLNGDRFSCEPRGEIDIKGKGTMKTYWLSAGPM